jgi:uncharacterized membrane protein
MLPECFTNLPWLFLQGTAKSNVFHFDTSASANIQLLLRWLHFIAGITWIGHLYFFNFVNGGFMKSLDGPTKGKVIPQLMPRALWWFRWGALLTVLAGITYFAMYLVSPDAHNAGANTGLILGVWLLIVLAAFVIEFFVLRSVNNGWTVAAIITVLVTLMAIAITRYLASSLGDHATSRTLSIGIGGALGTIMLLNVWGIIWPNQKRIIAWAYDNAEKGTAVPAANAKLARVAFLASRANTWLSLPLLLFMAASGGHYSLLGV